MDEFTASIKMEMGECGFCIEKRYEHCLKINNIKEKILKLRV
jgi:hypothetical protein